MKHIKKFIKENTIIGDKGFPVISIAKLSRFLDENTSDKKTITIQLEVEKIRGDGEFTKVLYGGHTWINVKNNEIIG